MNESQFLRVVRASAWYDLIATAAFATPWSFGVLIGVLGAANGALGLPGIVPEIDSLHVVLANLLGSVVIVWSLVRLHLRLPILGRYDALARCLFALWQGYAVWSGAPAIILGFLVVEVLFGVLQLLPYKKD